MRTDADLHGNPTHGTGSHVVLLIAIFTHCIAFLVAALVVLVKLLLLALAYNLGIDIQSIAVGLVPRPVLL